MRKDFSNTKPREKRTFVTKSYNKKCVSIDSAFEALIEAHPEIENVLYPTITDEDGKSFKSEPTGDRLNDMIYNSLTYMMMKSPDVRTMKNMRVSFSLRPNKMVVQTDAFVTFSWYITYKKQDKFNSTIESVDLTIILNGQRSIDEYEDALTMLGWEAQEEK